MTRSELLTQSLYLTDVRYIAELYLGCLKYSPSDRAHLPRNWPNAIVAFLTSPMIETDKSVSCIF